MPKNNLNKCNTLTKIKHTHSKQWVNCKKKTKIKKKQFAPKNFIIIWYRIKYNSSDQDLCIFSIDVKISATHNIGMEAHTRHTQYTIYPIQSECIREADKEVHE